MTADLETEADPDAPAAPRVCVRCSAESMLSVVGFCAGCVADIGLHHPAEYETFRTDVAATYGRK